MRLLHLLTLGLLAHRGAAAPAAPAEHQATDLSDHHLQRRSPKEPDQAAVKVEEKGNGITKRSPDTPEPGPDMTGVIVPNSYTVILKDGAKKTAWEHAAWASKIHEENPDGLDGVRQVMDWPDVDISGYFGDFSDKTIDKIRKDKDVKKVENDIDFPDITFIEGKEHWPEGKPKTDDHLDEENLARHKSKRGKTSALSRDVAEQTDAPWGLSHISNAPSGRYHYKKSAGEGTYIYVLDSGIDLEHEDFEGRAEFGFDATAFYMGSAKPQLQDLRHGTHVASVAAGAKFGVAKKAKVIDVKVIRMPQELGYSNEGQALINGLNWAVSDIKRKSRVSYAVINLSLQQYEGPHLAFTCGALSHIIDSALRRGIHVVISAGNWNVDAAKSCPGNTKEAITVGAVDEDNRRWTHPSGGGSNWGSHVDIFAPGKDIPGALSLTGSAWGELTGTSFAAPHVSGVIACLIADEGPRHYDDMWKRLEALSQKKKVKDPKGGQNRLLYNGVNG